HIADSAQLIDFVDSFQPKQDIWLDLGTGAGLPGLVIAIMRPDWKIALVESRRRRVEWLSEIRNQLKLANCRIIGSRLELVDSFSASVISARAFAPMPRLLDLAKRFSTDETLWLLPKGRSAAQDLSGLSNRMRRMFHVEQSCTDPDAGIIVGCHAGKGA
ncbi:MAG: 16S rRNA (guanine(527)-N(7))-methyltransferase RsmG, partial [Sphingomonadaceae bacterium]